MNLPNAISLARLLGVPVIVWLLLRESWTGAFVVFVLAGLSDAVDGYLAKRLDQRSPIGAYLDPIADKTLMVAIYLTLGIKGAMAFWLVILVVSRDLLIVGGALLLLLLDHGRHVAASAASRVNTALQIVFAALVIGGLAFPIPGIVSLEAAFAILVAISTVVSGAGYLVAWVRRVSALEGSP